MFSGLRRTSEREGESFNCYLVHIMQLAVHYYHYSGRRVLMYESHTTSYACKAKAGQIQTPKTLRIATYEK